MITGLKYPAEIEKVGRAAHTRECSGKGWKLIKKNGNSTNESTEHVTCTRGLTMKNKTFHKQCCGLTHTIWKATKRAGERREMGKAHAQSYMYEVFSWVTLLFSCSLHSSRCVVLFDFSKMFLCLFLCAGYLRSKQRQQVFHPPFSHCYDSRNLQVKK